MTKYLEQHEVSKKIIIVNHMISSAIWNKKD